MEKGPFRGFTLVGVTPRFCMACKGSGVQIPSAPHLEIPCSRRGFLRLRAPVRVPRIGAESAEGPREIGLLLWCRRC